MRHAALALALLALAGCGSSGGKPNLSVSAAASLTGAFTRYGDHFSAANVRYSFAGSDQLAAQIRAGLRPDVFAAANVDLPQALYRARLVARPVVFATNRLVIAVPAPSSQVHSLAELERRGVTLATGTPAVPVGAYTRAVLGRLPPGDAARLRANVRSEEPDVTAIVGKLSEGAVDAGFLYATDVAATHGGLRAIALPARLEPGVAYAAAVVGGAPHPAQARAFVAGLLTGAGRRSLAAAGFGPPPQR